jgi:protein-S-isoprenylcysteine O-methyltransferase Ste14
MLATDFQLGVWNAWVLVWIYFLVSIIPLFFKKKQRNIAGISPTNVEKNVYASVNYWISFILFILVFIISVFIPIRFYSIWFYPGMVLYVVGMFFIVFAIHSWMVTPEKDLITSGIYRFSRNPMYVSMFFTHVGIGLVCVSWVFMLLTLVYIVVTVILVGYEEEACRKKYGKSYEKYKASVPRWLGFRKK